MFKVAIVGGESMGDYRFFVEKCAFFLKNKTKNGLMILTIGDKFVDILTTTANIDKQMFYCDWKAHGNDAIKNRNEKIIKESDAFIVFDDGTKGTNFFIKMARESCKPIRIIKR